MATAEDRVPLPNKYGILLFIALIAAGLAGNYLKYPIFLNIDFLFGSIFALLAMQFFGLGRGILAATIIASYTYITWNHPYAIIIMAAEVMVVGWLFERRKMGLVLADTLYWLIIGMPLVYLFYHGVMHVPMSSTNITMTKQAINGIANALIARLIFSGYLLGTRTAQISYREIVYNLLALFVLFPTLILLAVGSRADFTAMEQNIRTSLEQDKFRDNKRLDMWVISRKAAIILLAEEAATKTPQQMQPYLEHTKKSDVNFLRIGLLDSKATITAFSPLIDELGHTNLGKNFADRPYIPKLHKTLKPMLSEVVMGRMGTPKPIVTVLAPVMVRREYGGYIAGILDLSKIEEYFDSSTGQSGRLYTLIDKNGNVIMTNRVDQKVMTPFIRPEGTLKSLDKQISQWIPKLSPNTPASEKWKKSYYFTESNVGDLAEWKLLLEQPMAPFQKIIFDNYTSKLSILFFVLFGALALAELISRQFIATHENLLLITRDLPAKVAKGENIDWPVSGVMEVSHLIRNFEETASSLATQFYEIQQINDSLEQRIEDRTAQLNDLKYELDIILDNAPIGITKVVNRKIKWCNSKWPEMLGYSVSELVSQTTRKLYPSEEAYEKVVREAYPILAQNLIFETEQELICKDGTQTLTRYIGKSIDPSDISKGVIWLVEDITKRRQEAEERKALDHQLQETQKLESLGVLAGGIAHDFNNILAIIIGYCALTKMDPGKVEKNLTKIEKAAERAAALCRQMLEYAGHTQIAKIQINMGILVTEMVEMLSSAGHKNIAIKHVITPNLPLIHGDAGQIRQIAINLIINATEAIGDAQGDIDVMVTKITVNGENPEKDHRGKIIPPGSYVCLEVTDTGCGMDEETLRRIFEPFYTTKFTGRGLGLSATLGIISGHDGALQIFSRQGTGTTFKVYLPVLVKEAGLDSSQHNVKASLPWNGNGTILLVEDEDQVRLVAKLILQEFGFTVIEAINGKEAMDLYLKNSATIALVITDLGMPIMDGYQLFFELKKLNPELPIIISSGFGDRDITSKIPKESMAGLISKPYNPSQLQAVLKNIEWK